jgi:hypothetical protein
VYLIIRFSKFLTFLTLNYAILSLSTDIDVDQLIKDIKFITKNTFLIDNVFILISLTVAVFSFIVKQLLNPFVEIFLEHYFKLSFYFLVNLISISTTYILLRIYGYSRLNLILYLILTTVAFHYFDKVEKKFI